MFERRCILHSRDEVIIIHGAMLSSSLSVELERSSRRREAETFMAPLKDERQNRWEKVCILKLLPRLQELKRYPEESNTGWYRKLLCSINRLWAQRSSPKKWNIKRSLRVRYSNMCKQGSPSWFISRLNVWRAVMSEAFEVLTILTVVLNVHIRVLLHNGWVISNYPTLYFYIYRASKYHLFGSP